LNCLFLEVEDALYGSKIRDIAIGKMSATKREQRNASNVARLGQLGTS
jgi:hypothetical protein